MKHPSLGKTDRLIISTLDLNSSELGKVLMKYLDEKRKLKLILISSLRLSLKPSLLEDFRTPEELLLYYQILALSQVIKSMEVELVL